MMIRCYRSEIAVDSIEARSIELATRIHDDGEAAVWRIERSRRTHHPLLVPLPS